MNLGTRLHQSAIKHPSKPAVICRDEVVSFEELDRSTDALARWLLEQRLDPGDRLAIHWCNSNDVAKLYYACFKAGIIAVPVNIRLKPAEIAYILQHSKARLCFSQPELAPLCEEVRAECPDLMQLHTALPALDLTQAPPTLPHVSPEYVAAVLYTSGTTARPKGVMHSHISLTGATELMISLGMDETHTVLVKTQLMHIAAFACGLLPAITCGATAVMLPVFEPAACLDLIERWRCTYYLTLPALLRFVVEEQERHPRDVGSMRLCIAGGDTVPVKLQETFRTLFGVPVREILGMTESVPITCIRENAPRAGSVGPAMDLVDTRVMDLQGNLVTDGGVGELQVQSPANCVGYWANPEATAATYDDGWLRTGDLVRCDADGFYWFEGRAKQIIVRAGSNISPQEVEEALYHHPAVLEAGVIGMPCPVLGEREMAFVALREGRTATEEELRAFALSRIADYKAPERIFFLPELPKGLSGKIQRRALKEMMQNPRPQEQSASA